jgi:hypothetical protein
VDDSLVPAYSPKPIFMLTSILFILLRNHFKKHPFKNSRFYSKLISLNKKPIEILLLLLISVSALAQEQNLRYSINRGGKKVGDLSVTQLKAGTKTTYTLESQVKVNFILSFTVKAKEQTVYENDIFQSSSLCRTVNGKEKANKQIKNNGKGLTVIDDGEEEELKNYLVKYSTHCLYANEPVIYTNVFSDNYKKFVPIEKLSDHKYKIKFPDGNTNEYHYENGVCKKVIVRSSLFDAEFVLTN